MTEGGLGPLLLTPEQAAEMCQVSRGTFDGWTHRAGFPVIRRGRVVRVPLELLKSWLADESLRTNAPAPTPLVDVSQRTIVRPARQR